MKLNTIQYIILILLIGSVNLFSSCKDDDGHDAGSPVVVNRFYPTSGSAGTEILITGKNFSENPEDISVTLGNIPLKVLNCSMNNILAIVPPKLGDGELTITIANREPVRTIDKFTYSFSAVVTTLAGSANGEPGYQDGVGSEALFFFDAAKAEPTASTTVSVRLLLTELSRLWQDWPEIKVALTEQEYRHALTDFTEWIAMRKEI